MGWFSPPFFFYLMAGRQLGTGYCRSVGVKSLNKRHFAVGFCHWI